MGGMAVGRIGEVAQLMLLHPIRRGPVPGNPDVSYRQRVELVAFAAMQRIVAGGPSPLRNVPTLLFAQWTILDLDGPGEGWLQLSAAFNGEPTQYLHDLLDLVGPEVDALYENCIDYPGRDDPSAFLDYARRYAVQPNIFYPSAVLRGVSMTTLRRLAGIDLDGLPLRRRTTG